MEESNNSLRLTSKFLHESLQSYKFCAIETGNQKGIIIYIRKFLLFYCMTVHVILAFADSLQSGLSASDIVERLIFGVDFLVGSLKVAIWYFYKKRIIQMMNNIDDEIPNIGEENEKFKKIVEEENAFKKWICNGVIVGFWLTVLGVVGGWLLKSCNPHKDYFQDFVVANETVKIYTLKMPFPVWLPFEYRHSKTEYMIVSSVTSAFVVQFIYIVGGSDGMFFSLICFVCAHIEMLKHVLKTTHSRHMNKESIVNDNGKVDIALINKGMEEEIRKTAIYLNSILEFCGLIEIVYSKILLVQTISAIGFLGFSLVIITQATKHDERYVFFIMFLGCMMTTVYFYCYFGNRLTTMAGEIPEALYENNWLRASKAFKTSMLIIMVRTSKPLYLSIGGISPITLSTFLQVIKTAYSVLAVMRNAT